MPSSLHEAIVELLRATPQASLGHLAALASMPVPADGEVEVEAVDATMRNLAPTEHRADLVLRVGPAGAAAFIVVVEVQRAVDKDKTWRWPRYATCVRDDRKCPVALVVLATDEGVAAWARQPIEVGPGHTMTPWVVGPGDVPRFETLPESNRNARAALLSAALHVDTLDDLRTFQAATSADWPLRGVSDIGGDDGYHQVLLAVLNPGLRVIVEAQVSEKTVDPLFDKLKNYFLAQGIEKGIEKGMEKGIEKGALQTARAIFLRLAHQRGWGLGPEQKRKLDTCRDPEKLSTWVERVVSAASLDEALAG